MWLLLKIFHEYHAWFYGGYNNEWGWSWPIRTWTNAGSPRNIHQSHHWPRSADKPTAHWWGGITSSASAKHRLPCWPRANTRLFLHSSLSIQPLRALDRELRDPRQRHPVFIRCCSKTVFHHSLLRALLAAVAIWAAIVCHCSTGAGRIRRGAKNGILFIEWQGWKAAQNSFGSNFQSSKENTNKINQMTSLKSHGELHREPVPYSLQTSLLVSILSH